MNNDLLPDVRYGDTWPDVHPRAGVKNGPVYFLNEMSVSFCDRMPERPSSRKADPRFRAAAKNARKMRRKNRRRN